VIELATETSTSNDLAFQGEIIRLAQDIFPTNPVEQRTLAARVNEMFILSTGKDFLVLHSPGGWGCTKWDDLLDWEKSIVTGVTATLDRLGYSYHMMQYLRSKDGLWRHTKDCFREARFFLTGRSFRADVMSKELRLLAKYRPGLRFVLVGASQGAAFDNAVMMKLTDVPIAYSIELGTFFPHMPRRLLSKRTLAIDSNGIRRDPMCERDLWAGFRAYIKAFYRWFENRATGKHTKFTHLINTPGHEYQWEYPAVRTGITDFLETQFGEKQL